jgi:hypothetical protein
LAKTDFSWLRDGAAVGEKGRQPRFGRGEAPGLRQIVQPAPAAAGQCGAQGGQPFPHLGMLVLFGLAQAPTDVRIELCVIPQVAD